MSTTTSAPSGAITWFEPPTADIGASTAFFARALETVLDGAAASADGAPCEAGGGYGAVRDPSAAIARRTATGWRPLTEIIEPPAGIGRIAYMLDTAGTRVGLHEPGRLA